MCALQQSDDFNFRPHLTTREPLGSCPNCNPTPHLHECQGTHASDVSSDKNICAAIAERANDRSELVPGPCSLAAIAFVFLSAHAQKREIAPAFSRRCRGALRSMGNKDDLLQSTSHRLLGSCPSCTKGRNQTRTSLWCQTERRVVGCGRAHPCGTTCTRWRMLFVQYFWRMFVQYFSTGKKNGRGDRAHGACRSIEGMRGAKRDVT